MITKVVVLAFVIVIMSFGPAFGQDDNIVLQPGPGSGKDIWTTSVYSFTPEGGGPGGGLDDEWLQVGGWADYYYSLIEFDLTGLPEVAQAATLELYVGMSKGVGTTGMYLDRITEFWDWTTQGTGSDYERLWWADRPATVPWIVGTIPAPTVGQWYSIDITDLYNAWQAGTYPNYGLQLRPENNGNRWNEFYSSDYPDNPSLRPKLVIQNNEDFSLQFPVDDYLSSICFDWGHPRTLGGLKKLHVGQDVSCHHDGLPVYAIADGIVKYARPRGTVCDNWGTVVVIEHTFSNEKRACSIYGHVDYDVSENQSVHKGEQIGTIGNYGPCPTWTWVDHLHFGVYAGEYGGPYNEADPYPNWLTGYLTPGAFPENYRKPSDFIQEKVNNNLDLIIACPASMKLVTPENDSISPTYNTTDSCVYTSWISIYGDGKFDQITAPDPGYGSYMVFVLPDIDATDTSTYTLYSGMNDHIVMFASHDTIINAPASGFELVLPNYLCGDANADQTINVGDAVYLINYIFKGGPAPEPIEAGDANCDGTVNVGDAVYLISYIFKGGPEPCCP